MVHLTRKIAGRTVRVETHRQPHLDEIGGLWLIEMFADDAWVQVHCPDGQLQLGVGGGEFDDHGRPERVSCMTLVARSLGVVDHSALAQILRYVHQADVEGKDFPGGVFNGVKLINQKHPNDPRYAVRWAYAWLNAKYDEQKDFDDAVEAARGGEKHNIGRFRVLMVTSDCKTLLKAALWAWDPKPDVVVQQNYDGHVMIFTNRKSGVDLGSVVAKLRQAEAEARGYTYPFEADMSATDLLDPDKTWYYFKPENGEMILNGSHTATVPATRLSLEQVKACVKAGLK